MKYPNIKRNQRDIIQSKTNQNQISNIITIEFMPLLLHRISLPVRFGLCAHSTHPRAGCQTRAKKQSLTQSVRPRKVGSAPGGLTACYRLTAHKNPLLVRAHGSELLGHFVVPAPLIMQPSEEAKRAIPIHEFYSPFVFWNNFYQFRKCVHRSQNAPDAQTPAGFAGRS